jgi:hypothetical protein
MHNECVHSAQDEHALDDSEIQATSRKPSGSLFESAPRPMTITVPVVY